MAKREIKLDIPKTTEVIIVPSEEDRETKLELQKANNRILILEARNAILINRSEKAMTDAEEVYLSVSLALKAKSRMLKCSSCPKKCLLIMKDEPLELNQIWKMPCPLNIKEHEWKITSINKQMKGKTQQFGEAGHNVFFDCDETGRMFEKWKHQVLGDEKDER
jgi:hypothetical protein